MPSDSIETGDTSARGAASSGSTDPEVLVAEIERTREDLAHNLDAIADRVSPKRVTERTKQRVTEVVKEKTAVAKEVVSEKAAVAKDVVNEKTAVAKGVVTEKSAQAKAAVQERRHGSGDDHATTPVPAPLSAQTDEGLPPVAAVEVPGLAPRPVDPAASGPAPWTRSQPAASPQVIGGAVAALVGLLLLLRRRRRS